ncbi:hypothetical protein Tco_0545813 [Tanacetum coccineum]
MNKELTAFNKLESNRFVHLQEELIKVIKKQIGKKVKAKVRTGMSKVTERLDTLLNSTEDNSVNISKLKRQMTELVSLLQLAKVLKQNTAEGEKSEKENQEQPKEVNVEGEQQDKLEQSKDDDTAEKVSNLKGTLVVHTSEVKGSEEKTSDDEPSAKRLDPTPPRDERKGKGIADEGEKMKQLIPLMDQSRLDPNMLNLQNS